MKSKLFNLFDFQRFEQNKELAEVIDASQAGTKAKRVALSDEALEFAAGGVSVDPGAGDVGFPGEQGEKTPVKCQYCPNILQIDLQKDKFVVCPQCLKTNTFEG